MGWSWFSLGREEGFPSHYADQHTPAHVDILSAGLILSFIILGISYLFILPAYNSQKKYIKIFCYTFLSLFIGGIILVCNFGYSWEVGNVHITSPYKPTSPDEVQGEIGLHVSLRGINITLKGEIKPRNSSDELYYKAKEIIDYNENFSWEWVQGRFGFGYYAGRISKDYRAAIIRGVPIPILQLSEYFTFDGEGIRFGRHYRLAGYYAHFFLWVAFVTWILSNIFFFKSINPGSFFLTLTGCLQVVAILIWTLNRNVIELQVPYESKDGHGEVILVTSYGLDYYLVLGNGIFCIVLGIGIYILISKYNDKICDTFGIDMLTLYQEDFQIQDSVEIDRDSRKNQNPRITIREDTSENHSEDIPLEAVETPSEDITEHTAGGGNLDTDKLIVEDETLNAKLRSNGSK